MIFSSSIVADRDLYSDFAFAYMKQFVVWMIYYLGTVRIHFYLIIYC